MPSFYFLWNPTKRPDLSEKLGKISGLLPDDKRLRKYWSTGSRTAKNFPSGSRFFLVRTKIEPRGVIGYGTILTGKLLPGAHPWKDGKKAAYVKINFENLIDSQKNPEKVLSLEFLETAGFKLKVSKPQGGGTEIPDEAAAQDDVASDRKAFAGLYQVRLGGGDRAWDSLDSMRLRFSASISSL